MDTRAALEAEGYIAVAKHWPTTFGGGASRDLEEWSRDHLVRFHGFTDEEIEADRISACEVRHAEHHESPPALWIPHLHVSATTVNYLEVVRDALRGFEGAVRTIDQPLLLCRRDLSDLISALRAAESNRQELSGTPSQ